MAKKTAPKKTAPARLQIAPTDAITRHALRHYHGKPLPKAKPLPPAGHLTDGVQDIAEAVARLVAEHRVVQHCLLLRLVTQPHGKAHIPLEEVIGHGSTIQEDIADMLSHYTRTGGGFYGRTLATAGWVHVPLYVEDDGTAIRKLKSGTPSRTPDKLPGSVGMYPAAATITPAIIRRWVDAYLAEVDEFCKRFKGHDELASELDHLTNALQGFQWGIHTQAFLGATPDAQLAVEDLTIGRDRLLAGLKMLSRPPSPPPPLPSGTKQEGKPYAPLKSLALVHALRFLNHDTSADINSNNQQNLASSVECNAPSSGAELFRHYWNYTRTADGYNNRTSGRHADVLKRYDQAIIWLNGFKAAQHQARKELAEVKRSRLK